MGDILLAVMIFVVMVAVFVLGYYVTDRFGKFMDKNYRGKQESYVTDGKIYITETKGKSTKTVLKEVGTMLDSLPDHEDYEIIICKAGSHGIIEFLAESDYTIEDDSGQ